jgi:hypothetical protein
MVMKMQMAVADDDGLGLQIGGWGSREREEAVEAGK